MKNLFFLSSDKPRPNDSSSYFPVVASLSTVDEISVPSILILLVMAPGFAIMNSLAVMLIEYVSCPVEEAADHMRIS